MVNLFRHAAVFLLADPGRVGVRNMSAKVKELQAKREQLAAKIKDIGGRFDHKENKWSDAADQGHWEAVNKDYDATNTALEAAVQQESIASRIAQVDQDASQPAWQPPMPRGPRNAGQQVLQDPDSPLRGMPAEDIANAAMNGYVRTQAGFRASKVQRAALKAMAASQVRDQTEGRCFQLYDSTRPDAQRKFRDLQAQFRNLHPSRMHNAPLTTGTASTGGASIPAETFMPQFETAMLAFGGLLAHATIWQTSGGEPLSFPSMNDTGNSARIVAESALSNDNAGGGSAGDGGPNPTFAKTTWNAYKYASDTLLIPYELLQDTGIDLMPTLQAMVGERIARGTEAHFATGDDSSKPQGITVGSHTGLTVASATAITTAELITFQHSLDPSYRVGAAWMMHDNVVLYIRKLVDGQGNFIWASGFNGGAPDTLLGAPLYVNNSMTSSLASNNYVAVYGLLKNYYIRRAGGLRIKVLQELYAAKDQIGLVAFLRTDGGVYNAGGNPIKRLRMAA